MKITHLDNINKTYFSGETRNKAILDEQTNSAKENGNSKLKMTLTCLGIAGAAVAIGIGGKAIYKHFNPKTVKSVGDAAADKITNPVNAVVKTNEKITNKFLNTSGEEVSVAFHEKGIAKVGDNLFSGKLEQTKTVDGKENKTVVEYINGKVRRTIVNGQLRKGFIYNYDNSETINLFNEEGNYLGFRIHYHDPQTGRVNEASIFKEVICSK